MEHPCFPLEQQAASASLNTESELTLSFFSFCFWRMRVLVWLLSEPLNTGRGSLEKLVIAISGSPSSESL